MSGRNPASAWGAVAFRLYGHNSSDNRHKASVAWGRLQKPNEEIDDNNTSTASSESNTVLTLMLPAASFIPKDCGSNRVRSYLQSGWADKLRDELLKHIKINCALKADHNRVSKDGMATAKLTCNKGNCLSFQFNTDLNDVSRENELEFSVTELGMETVWCGYLLNNILYFR